MTLSTGQRASRNRYSSVLDSLPPVTPTEPPPAPFPPPVVVPAPFDSMNADMDDDDPGNLPPHFWSSDDEMDPPPENDLDSPVSHPRIFLIIPHCLVLWSIFLSTGKRCLTEDQYKLIRSLISCAMASGPSHWRDINLHSQLVAPHRERAAFPSYSTLLRSIRPAVMTKLVVSITEIITRVCLSSSRAKTIGKQTRSYPTAQVSLVLPSTYAQMDIGTSCIYNSFLSNDLLDTMDIIRQRERFFSFRHSVILDGDTDEHGRFPIASVGDSLNIELYNPIVLNQSSIRPFLQNGTGTAMQLRGVVTSVFLVQHHVRRPSVSNSTVQDFDPSLVDFFSYMKFDEASSCRPKTRMDIRPGGSSVVHLSKRKRKSSAASSSSAHKSSKEPVPPAPLGTYPLKPGDIVAVLRPLDSVQEASPRRIFIVHRFWVSSNESSRFLLLLNPQHIFDTCEGTYIWKNNFLHLNKKPLDYYCELIRSLTRAIPSTDPRAVIPLTAPTTGTLQDGRRYFIYRYLLFADGFLTSMQSQVSSEGIYIVPLNFPIQTRKSSSTGRVISAVPPGVSPCSIIRALFADILRGCTIGFPSVDAEGNELVLFTDLVAVFGDTPALNKMIDTGTHSAASPCHLCRCKATAIDNVGSKFTNITPRYALTAAKRFYLRQRAVRDSAPSKSTLQFLGMKQDRTIEHQLFEDLYDRVSAAQAAFRPIDSNGSPLFAPPMDPFVGSLITPDHLVTRLATMAINFALFALPTPGLRIALESQLTEIFQANRIEMPHALVDSSIGKLVQLSMTQSFTVLVFFPVAYTIVCRKSFERRTPPPVRAAAELTRHIHNLYALVANPPQIPVKIKEFQSAVVTYLATVRKVSLMTEDDLRGTNNQPLHHKRLEGLLSRIGSLDVPTLHRLYEYAFLTLPMVQFPAFTRELAMEKMHTNLKQLLQRVKNTRAHRYAMKNTAIDDWKSRLSLLRIPIDPRDRGTIRTAVRLLGGINECVKLTPSYPTSELVAEINIALSGGGFTPLTTIPRGVSVFPLKANSDNLWKTTDTATTHILFSHPFLRSLPEGARNLLKRVAQKRRSDADGLYFCESIQKLPLYGVYSTKIRKDSFISVDCYDPSSPILSRPLVRQVSRYFNNPNFAHREKGKMMCRIVAILTTGLTAPGSQVVFIVHIYCRSSTNIFEFRRDFLHFPSYSLSDPNMSFLYGDGSITSVAHFEFDSPLIKDTNKCLFLFGSSSGYPARKG